MLQQQMQVQSSDSKMTCMGNIHSSHLRGNRRFQRSPKSSSFSSPSKPYKPQGTPHQGLDSFFSQHQKDMSTKYLKINMSIKHNDKIIPLLSTRVQPSRNNGGTQGAHNHNNHRRRDTEPSWDAPDKDAPKPQTQTKGVGSPDRFQELRHHYLDKRDQQGHQCLHNGKQQSNQQLRNHQQLALAYLKLQSQYNLINPKYQQINQQHKHLKQQHQQLKQQQQDLKQQHQQLNEQHQELKQQQQHLKQQNKLLQQQSGYLQKQHSQQISKLLKQQNSLQSHRQASLLQQLQQARRQSCSSSQQLLHGRIGLLEQQIHTLHCKVRSLQIANQCLQKKYVMISSNLEVGVLKSTHYCSLKDKYTQLLLTSKQYQLQNLRLKTKNHHKLQVLTFEGEHSPAGDLSVNTDMSFGADLSCGGELSLDPLCELEISQ